MTSKAKIKVSVAIIILSVVMVAMAIIGVCLSLNRSYTFNGKISIISSDIQATISKASITGGELVDNNKMQQIEVDGLITETDKLNYWEDLNFELSNNSKDVVIRVNIVNHSTDKTLKISLGEVSAKTTNTSVSVKFDGMDEGVKTAYIARAKTNQQGVVIEESFKQLVITLHASKKNRNTSLTDFNIPIALLSTPAHVIEVTNQCDKDRVATVVHTDVDTTSQQLNHSLELCGNSVTITNQTEHIYEYRFIVNGSTPTTYTIQAGDNITFAIDSDSSVIIVDIKKVG